MRPLDVPPRMACDGLPLFSLRDINRLDPAEKEVIYRELIPDPIFLDYGIDPTNCCGQDGRPRVRFVCPAGLGLARIEVRRDPADRDCLFFVELADTAYHQVELSFCLVNDPDAERFDIDVDEKGRENSFGTLRRNIPEEIRAMEAGLSPNQIRRGLKMFSPFFRRLELFVSSLGIDTIVAEPLSYNNAIRYEKYGFDYLCGKQLMLWIDREFQPGGVLLQGLDGSNPFRRPGMERTVRGRSWAIHDGILPQTWDEVKIYKVVGLDAGIDTFPGRVY